MQKRYEGKLTYSLNPNHRVQGSYTKINQSAINNNQFNVMDLSSLISNTQRSLTAFERHFALDGLFAVAISSSDHGYMKPHPSIFQEGLRRACVEPAHAVMVGDSVRHDIEGARSLGMRGILVARSGLSTGAPADVPIIRSLRELKEHL